MVKSRMKGLKESTMRASSVMKESHVTNNSDTDNMLCSG